MRINEIFNKQIIAELDIRSSKSYTQVDDYRMYPVYVSNKKFKNKYFIATALHPRTFKEFAKASGDTQQQAIDNLHSEIEKMFANKPVVNGNAVIDFNVEFANNILSFPGQPFYAKIIEGPNLVIAGKEMLEYPEIMADEGFKKSSIRNKKDDAEGSTRLPAIAYTARQISGKGLKANARYLIGNESKDKDGNRVFDLIYDSDVYDVGHKVRLRKPGLTVGTTRTEGVEENFADGKNPGRKGLSQRVGIPKNATIAQLEKAAKAGGEKGRMARWQLNMRRGRKKK